MALQSVPKYYKQLSALIDLYNAAPDEDHIQRIFYLQKINYELNKTKLDDNLYNWLNNAGENTWRQHLSLYNINYNASIFLKGIQFAQALAAQIKDKPAHPTENGININLEGKEYPLMQERDVLLKNAEFTDCKEQYIALSLLLSTLADTDNRIKDIIEEHTFILHNAQIKLEAIKGNTMEEQVKISVTYKTEQLGNQVNNFNFKFTMSGCKQPFVFRLEDRSDLNLEQDLHSYPVAKYFIEDYSVSMMRVLDEDGDAVFKPVVLSQFANQGNLAEVARRLQKERKANVAPKVVRYFEQLADLCNKLLEAKVYHPDIKLTNFLVNNYRVLISDRKTLIDEENPFVIDVRSSPLFAPEEYLECLSSAFDSYKIKANNTQIHMPSFMAFQLGMALKEFLILTQMDELPDEFRDSDQSAASYFDAPPKQIQNLSFLIQELTRTDPTKRMSIKQFQRLLKYRNLSVDNFYKEVEKEFPAVELGIQNDINEINALLDDGNIFQRLGKYVFSFINPDYYGADLLARSNEIFKKISASTPRETRLTHLAEKLATKCFKEYGHRYFRKWSQLIEAPFLQNDWERAPWYRKALHWITFGYFHVEKMPQEEIDENLVIHAAKIKIDVDIKSKELQDHLQSLEFLPAQEFDIFGQNEGNRLRDYLYTHAEEFGTEEEAVNEPSFIPQSSLPRETGPLESKSKKSSSSEPTSDSLPSGSIEVKDDASNSLSSSVNIKANTSGSNGDYSEALRNVRFFSTPKANEEKKPVEAPVTKAGTPRKSFFRGDGSYRPSKKERKPVTFIDWTPLVENTSPISTINTPPSM